MMNFSTKVLLLVLSTAGTFSLPVLGAADTAATNDESYISSQVGNGTTRRRMQRSRPTSAHIGQRTPPSFQSRQQDIVNPRSRNLTDKEENQTGQTSNDMINIGEDQFWSRYMEEVASIPTPNPTARPTENPTLSPTLSPPVTAAPITPTIPPPTSPPPTLPPTTIPTVGPTPPPQVAPTTPPQAAPTEAPQPVPTAAPQPAPTAEPTLPPAPAPTASPTNAPQTDPTAAPTVPLTAAPTLSPTVAPTVPPTAAPTVPPTVAPTVPPTAAPVSPSPTASPTAQPTTSPTSQPTLSPTPAPTDRCTGDLTIYDAICSDPSLTTTCTLVENLGLAPVLADPNADLTIFAPTNFGWDLLISIIPFFPEPNQLQFILLYHVTEGRVFISDLVNNGLLLMVNGLNSRTFQVSSPAGTATFQFGPGNTNQDAGLVTEGDTEVCNGVVHVINGVILPSLDQIPPPAPLPPTLPPVPQPTALPVPTQPPVPAPTQPPIPAPTQPPVPAPTQPPIPAPTQPPVPAPTQAPVAPPTAAPQPNPTSAPVLTPTAAPTSVVLEAILPVALEGGAEFEDPNSCQSQALRRTEEQEGIDMMGDTKIIQYYALYCIYTCTNGVPNMITEAEGLVPVPGWIVTAGWESNTIDPCSGQWFGISCESDDQVTDIDLFSNLLSGSFPAEVSLLAADGPRSTGAGRLRRLDLFDNMLLTNNGDTSWWTFLGSEFAFFFFKDTAFSGPLGRLPDNIQEFDCSSSFINGGLTDDNFEGLNQLVFADLDGNAFNSTVPQVFSTLESLTFLYIVDGFISGDISYMIGMPAIREHWVDTNPGLGGLLPPELSTISTLESLSLSSCNFEGQIPTEFGNFGFVMRQLWLYDNTLTGQIPTELGLLSQLRLLQLEGNTFTGMMPTEVCANTMFPRPLEILGADCFDENFSCDCCTCCSVLECPP